MAHLRACVLALGLVGIGGLAVACSSQSTAVGGQQAVATQQSGSAPSVVAVARQLARPEPQLSQALAAGKSAWTIDGGTFAARGWLDGSDDYSVGARAPVDAASAFAVGMRNTLTRLAVTLEGARAVAPELQDPGVVYPGAYASTDVIMTLQGGRFEELLLLQDAKAPAEFAWSVGLPRGIAGVHVDEDGGATFVDDRGQGVLRVLPPFAVDAAGTRRGAQLTWADGRLAVLLDTTGLAFPILLDPAVQNAFWVLQNPATSPPLRDSYAMAFDGQEGTAVLFGGIACTSSCPTTALNDTWTWNGSTWTKMSPSTVPPARLWSGMAYDSAHGVNVMYGGSPPTLGTPDFSDTWQWNGTTWTQMSPAANPGARDQFAMAYDSLHGVTVLFGGEKCTNVHGCSSSTAQNYGFTLQNDTWVYNGTNWSQMTTSTAPAARIDSTMVFDSSRGVVVLFGGTTCYVNCSTDVEYDDTWEWNGSAWTQQMPANTPGGRDSFAMSYDSARGVTVLFGGYDGAADTWEWNGSNWTNTMPANPPPNLQDMIMVFDPIRGNTMMFGGSASATDVNTTYTYQVDGNACTTGSQCDTGFCVDGVCCQTSSCGTCQACNTAASPGTCAAVTNGPGNNCTGTQTCDANGNCKLVVGQACPDGNSDCANGDCVSGYCCDSACTGACETCAQSLGATANGTCSPASVGYSGNPVCAGGYLCNGTSDTCPTSCSTDTDCATGYFCGASGTCQAQKAQGGTCSAAAGVDCLRPDCRECASGNCVDGVCCDSVCSGACDVCTQALGAPADGTCTEAPVGYAGAPTCYPYVCGGMSASCPGACASASDCAAGAFCTAGKCQGTETAGQSCGSNAACVSDFCVDGVCCNSACTGQCEACNVEGSAGTCTPVAGAPHGNRTACPGGTPAEPCTAAECDGTTRTSCMAFVGSSVTCRVASCTNDVATLAAVCNGMGSCPPSQTKMCAPYVCNGNTCQTQCAGDTDCAAGERCDTSTSKCVAGLTCDGNHTITGANGQTTNCAPYTCTPAGCQTSCQSIADCVAPADCNASGQCVLPPASSGSSGGCTVSPVREGTGATEAGGLALLAVAASWRRRRRPDSRGGAVRR